MSEGTTVNTSYDRTERTIGLTYKLHQGAAFKADYQLLGNAASEEDKKMFNLELPFGSKTSKYIS